MIEFNPNTDNTNGVNAQKNKKQTKQVKSIFEKNDKDGIVNEQDFLQYKEIGQKVSAMGYFGLAWNTVRSIITTLFANTISNNNDNNNNITNMLAPEMKLENQTLVKDVYPLCLAGRDIKISNIKEDLKAKGIDFTESGRTLSYQENWLNVTISYDEKNDKFITEIKNQEGQLLQKITAGEITRGGSSYIENYDKEGRVTYSISYQKPGTMNNYRQYDNKKLLKNPTDVNVFQKNDYENNIKQKYFVGRTGESVTVITEDFNGKRISSEIFPLSENKK